jgi:hypothetical protein
MWACSRQRIDLNQRRKTLEIRAVERHQSVYAAVEHRRHDVRVVDLAARNAMSDKGSRQELCVAVRHRRTDRQLVVRMPCDSLAAAGDSTAEWAEVAGYRAPASQ